MAEQGASGIAYQEVFGPHPDQCAESLAGLQARVAELGCFATGRVRIGVSPHAPYTVSGPLFRSVARWAKAERLPIAVHIAESAPETELLAHGTGAFADAWRGRQIPLPVPLGRTPVAWLGDHEVLSPETLCIHAVRTDSADRALLAREGCSVAHCPLSNAAHGHGHARLSALLEAGLRVGLGTDSVMSVGRLDLLAEARAARTLAQADGGSRARALHHRGGASAGNAATRSVRLEPGKWGDCVVIRCGARSRRARGAGVGERSAGRTGDSSGRERRVPSQAVGMKIQRHAAILRVVRDRRIESQDELREALEGEGFNVTQATLSRDIRELGLAKLADPQGGAYYTHPHRAAVRPDLAQVLPTLLVSVDGVGPLLVLKTASGSAGAVTEALDQAGWGEVIGTIAGDDTVLVITRSQKQREAIASRINGLVRK